MTLRRFFAIAVSVAIAVWTLVSFVVPSDVLAGTYRWTLYYTSGGATPAAPVDSGTGDSAEEALSECFQKFPLYGCSLINSQARNLSTGKDYREENLEPKCWCETSGPSQT